MRLFFIRLLGYDVLEARLKDKDSEIERLVTENRELRDRLFIKHNLPVSALDLIQCAKGESLPGYATKRQRLKEFINRTEPPLLSKEDLKALREAAQ